MKMRNALESPLNTPLESLLSDPLKTLLCCGEWLPKSMNIKADRTEFP
jgi:hypothetical protein